MITVIHGDHIEASRSELLTVKGKAAGKEIRELQGSKIDEQTLIQSLESSSLFGGDTVVIIELLFSRLGRQQKKIERLARLLVDRQAACDIIVWEDKELSAATLKYLGNPVVRLFKTPVIIFQFLDSIAPGQTRRTLELFEQLLTTEPPELVFSMIAKRMRQLLMIALGVTLPTMAGWQLSRLTTQAKSFRMEQLKKLYLSLADREYAVKSGNSAFDLKQHIEQWLMELST